MGREIHVFSRPDGDVRRAVFYWLYPVPFAGGSFEGLLMPLVGISFYLLAQGDAPGGLLGGAFGPILPFLVIGILFYLLLIRPERRKRQEMDKMLDSLKKDDQIITVGGVRGVVVNPSKGSEYITVRVDEDTGTKLRVLRSAVSRVLTDGKSDGSKDDPA